MKYFALLTKLGESLLAQATALGTQLELTQMAVGDGGGSLPTPDTNQTKLIAEKRRGAINSLFIDEKNKNQIIAEQIIPESEGGWWIREIGLLDKAGNLIAVANCPETYKPQLAEGSGRTQSIRMILIVSHTAAVTLKIDPAVVLATREYVDNLIQVQDKKLADLSAKIQFDLTNKIDKASIVGAKSNDNDKVPSIKLLTDEIAKLATSKELITKFNEVNNNTTKAQSTANTAATAATNANNNANGRVPIARKINSKPLNNDITLSASDVGSYTKAEVDTKVAEAKKAATNAQATANTAATAATNANNNANGRVPIARKINSKPLNNDITLSASDVGSYTKAEVDSKLKAASVVAVRLSGSVSVSRNINFSLNNGEVVTGLIFWDTGSNSAVNFGGYKKRTIQYLLNGSWFNAASV